MNEINFEKRYNKELNKNERLREKVTSLQDEIRRNINTQQIELLDKKIKESDLKWKRECLGLNKGVFVYLTYKRMKNEVVRSLMGYITKETLSHIKLTIHARNTNTVFSYHLKKENIIDIKNYNSKARNYISFEDLSKIKKRMKEEAKDEE